MRSEQRILPDQRVRDRIAEDLDHCLLIEAGAGSGKTHSMVGRMVALIEAGRCEVRTLAAVTFTRKAAAELRGRFQSTLEARARQAQGPARERLVAAARHAESCFVGTIHSFCGRLLRERPVEAGIDLAFQEADEETDARLRRQAWSEYVARMIAEEDPLLAELEAVDLTPHDLRQAFITFAEYPDVTRWPSRVPAFDDEGAAVAQLRAYLAHIDALELPYDPGNDTLIPRFRRILRQARRTDLSRRADVARLLEEFGSAKKLVQKVWPGKSLKEKGELAKAEQARYDDFRATVAGHFLMQWRALRYDVVLRTLLSAMAVYDRLRQSAGMLNYQDLLLRAARLLRENRPHVRAYFRERFTHLLVDEFQDTDPVQAEVMLLLTADDPNEADWRRCRPRAGSLFVVGDPKQSIYRFRRADIVTYNDVRRIIESSGGAVESLTANFRTVEPILEWNNRVFSDWFPPKATEYSPVYVPFERGREEDGPDPLPPIRRLVVPKEAKNKEQVIPYEADLIARTIRQALDERQPMPRTARERAAGRLPIASPDDFLILTRNTTSLGDYAAALQRYGIPHQVAGGNALNTTEELELLRVCLSAVLHPEDPVRLVATLRGRLFGTSDRALYAFKKLGGRFDLHAEVPESLDPSDRAALAEAFVRLRTYHRWLGQLPPAAAIERIVADLGLTALAAAQRGGSARAGCLAKTIELLRAAEAEMWTASDLVEYLDRLASQEEPRDGVEALACSTPVVRVMNLHKAKGLEAPVVFLACPYGEWEHPVRLHVDRSGAECTGYMAMYEAAEGYYSRIIAHPFEWTEMSDREQDFERWEKVRLLYVAATRAGARLIVTMREPAADKRVKANQYNPWEPFIEHLADFPPMADPGPRAAPRVEAQPIGPTDAEEAAARIDSRWVAVRAKSYDVKAAKHMALQSRPFFSLGGEHGTEWGSVIHLMLEALMRNPNADLRALALSALRDQELPPEQADEAIALARSVMASSLWARACAAKRRLCEAPFQMPLDQDCAVPTVLRGTIDLLFEEADGWVIVDYKTEGKPHRDLRPLVERYRPQVETYARAWERCTGERVKEAGLFFVGVGRYEVVMGDDG